MLWVVLNWDNFPYGATTFSLIFTKKKGYLIHFWGKLIRSILFYIEWKSGGAIRKLFLKLNKKYKSFKEYINAVKVRINVTLHHVHPPIWGLPTTKDWVLRLSQLHVYSYSMEEENRRSHIAQPLISKPIRTSKWPIGNTLRPRAAPQFYARDKPFVYNVFCRSACFSRPS